LELNWSITMKRYLALLLLSPSCFAAPFCVVAGGIKTCLYYSASQCRQAAATMDGMCVANEEDEPPALAPPAHSNRKNEFLNSLENLSEGIVKAQEQERLNKDSEQRLLQQEVEHQMRYDNDSLYREAYDKVMARKAAENTPKPGPAKRTPQPSYSSGAIFAVIVIFAGVAAVSVIATN
jgi:hypothetical protein